LTGGLNVKNDTTNAYGAFYDVLISRTTDYTKFALTTNSSFSGTVDVSVVGYQEQLYLGATLHHGLTVPDGQVMLDSGVHDAQVSIVGVSASSAGTYSGGLAYHSDGNAGGARDAWGVGVGWNDSFGHGPGPS
jgi:hypothetical protein